MGKRLKTAMKYLKEFNFILPIKNLLIRKNIDISFSLKNNIILWKIMKIICNVKGKPEEKAKLSGN